MKDFLKTVAISAATAVGVVLIKDKYGDDIKKGIDGAIDGVKNAFENKDEQKDTKKEDKKK
jgi:hypothetical protein|nr:MAG TPA: hypothetical protein [Caudoviricetes sp.]